MLSSLRTIQLRLCCLLAVSACLASNAAAQSWPASYALRGTLVTPDGIVENGVVLVDHGKIAAAGANVQLPPKVQVVETHGVIAPGLIDLHNHLTWNVFPRWHPVQEFGSRYDWQQKPVYQTLIGSPHQAMVAEGLECEMERYAEVKAISEGETASVGGLQDACSQGLIRNLDIEPEWRVAYNVFPFQMTEAELEPIRQQLAAHQLHAFLIHLAEGAHNDASAAREFSMLKGRGLLVPGVSLIHAVALKPENFVEMAAHGVNFVWSPRSNLELYGSTVDVAAARAAKVKIALAPDWSPTGSDGLLAELNYAAAWNDTQTPPLFTDRELVSMATAIPAAILGAEDRLGTLLAGRDADLLVVRSDPAPHRKAGAAAPDAYWVLTHATASQVALVIVDGAPVYGDPGLMATLAPAPPAEKLEVCGSTKALLLTGAEGHADAAGETWAQTTDTLQNTLRHHGRNLAVLAECGQ